MIRETTESKSSEGLMGGRLLAVASDGGMDEGVLEYQPHALIGSALLT